MGYGYGSSIFSSYASSAESYSEAPSTLSKFSVSANYVGNYGMPTYYGNI
jgi:hypothetical protein